MLGAAVCRGLCCDNVGHMGRLLCVVRCGHAEPQPQHHDARVAWRPGMSHAGAGSELELDQNWSWIRAGAESELEQEKELNQSLDLIVSGP